MAKVCFLLKSIVGITLDVCKRLHTQLPCGLAPEPAGKPDKYHVGALEWISAHFSLNTTTVLTHLYPRAPGVAHELHSAPPSSIKWHYNTLLTILVRNVVNRNIVMNMIRASVGKQWHKICLCTGPYMLMYLKLLPSTDLYTTHSPLDTLCLLARPYTMYGYTVAVTTLAAQIAWPSPPSLQHRGHTVVSKRVMSAVSVHVQCAPDTLSLEHAYMYVC